MSGVGESSGLDARRERLAGEVLACVEAGVDGDRDVFDRLAPEVFRYQYDANEPYRRFCDAAGVARDAVNGWADVPAYPTDAFKHEIVVSFPAERTVLANATSGTTAPNQRGRIFRDETGKRLVFAANRVMTASYLFPDLAAGARCRILLLVPGPDTAPGMGMAIGLDETRRLFGTSDSAFLISRTGVDVKRLVGALREAEACGTPVALIGATSAFVYFLNACRKRSMTFRLPEGSRVCDGGGYRGRFGVCTREDYHALAAEVLGVPAHRCVNTLGMAESATNYFDDVLRRRVQGLPDAPRRKLAPPWTRVLAFDPGTQEVLPDGTPGLLRHYDLCNLPTVLGVQTDNLGVTYGGGGFEIIGRAKVVDGVVSGLPAETSVGPMGDTRALRLLEAYVNFSIDFKMGRLTSADTAADYLELRRQSDAREGFDEGAPAESCPIAIEDLVAGAEDPEARERAEAALEAFRHQAEGDGPDR